MELADNYFIQLIKIDTNVQKYISGQLGVFIVPTVIIIYDGKEILRESRFIDFNKINKNLEYIYKNESLN